MTTTPTFTLTEIARRLRAPQHRLIHLCEKDVVEPDHRDASGRGSSRLFSARNLLEFALALRLREMMLPVAAVGAILHVLRSFEAQLRRERPMFTLPESLRSDSAPDLRIILKDGRLIFFAVGRPGARAKLFGRIPLDQLMAGEGPTARKMPAVETSGRKGSRSTASAGGASFGGPERSRYARLEVSVTEIARDLPLD